jgi:hypothetical protein
VPPVVHDRPSQHDDEKRGHYQQYAHYDPLLEVHSAYACQPDLPMARCSPLVYLGLLATTFQVIKSS